jgi:hypothetical protein
VSVDVQLIYNDLSQLTKTLVDLKDLLVTGYMIDDDYLRVLQQRADSIYNRLHRNFVNSKGQVTCGRNLLKDQLQRAYDLIHVCIMLHSEKERDLNPTVYRAVNIREKLLQATETATLYNIQEVATVVSELQALADGPDPRQKAAVSTYF